jgi:predicted DNA binding CopG/RHH family protein
VRPWLVHGVRDDLRKELNVRMPERLMIQLKAYATEVGLPLRDVVERFLQEGWNHEAKRLGWTGE